MKLPVLSVADGAGWEARLVTAWDAAPYGVEIVRRCVDVVDLVAVATSGQGRAALLDADVRQLDTDAVDRLLAVRVVPVGVVPRGNADAEARLHGLGVEHTVPDDAEPAVVAAVLLAATSADIGVTQPRGAHRAFADPYAPPRPPGGADPPRTDRPARQGSVVAVWGPTGAPGRTTVAITLADELARLGAASLLIDADVYGGTVASVLGLLDDSPGLAAACRQAGRQGGGPHAAAAALAALCWQLGPHLRVLTGIPLATRWPELRPASIPPVLAAARQLCDYAVVDLGFGLETDEELSYDTVAPRRNGATLAVLDEADLVLVVGSADPIGMQRLVRGLDELRDLGVRAAQRVLLNKVRDGVVPGDTRAELTNALQRFAQRVPAALLPWDRRALDAALATGSLLSERSPDSPLRHAVIGLAASVAGVDVGTPRRRGLRWVDRSGVTRW